MKQLEVALDDRSYPIYIGENLLARSELFSAVIRSSQLMIVTNETVAPLYLDELKSALKASGNDYEIAEVILPDGEQFKSLEILNRIFTSLLQNHFDRRCTLIALGGGVIGDMTGFAAACYQRGVDYIQVPTTLLSQVDSSVGGKTAVNHEFGKNMIGAFHQPKAVIADTLTLNTLDDRQLAAGIAEVIKYGLIRDSNFLEWLEDNVALLVKRDAVALAYAIERSCINKAEIVSEDELEAGVRALLNLGHTFGHAIETGMGYGEWLHGEAISAGMVMAADMSRRLGWLSSADVARVVELLKVANLPTVAPSSLSEDKFLALMAVDKKAQDGVIRLVLLQHLGQAVVDGDYDMKLLKETLQACREIQV